MLEASFLRRQSSLVVLCPVPLFDVLFPKESTGKQAARPAPLKDEPGRARERVRSTVHAAGTTGTLGSRPHTSSNLSALPLRSTEKHQLSRELSRAVSATGAGTWQAVERRRASRERHARASAGERWPVQPIQCHNIGSVRGEREQKPGEGAIMAGLSSGEKNGEKKERSSQPASQPACDRFARDLQHSVPGFLVSLVYFLTFSLFFCTTRWTMLPRLWDCNGCVNWETGLAQQSVAPSWPKGSAHCAVASYGAVVLLSSLFSLSPPAPVAALWAVMGGLIVAAPAVTAMVRTCRSIGAASPPGVRRRTGSGSGSDSKKTAEARTAPLSAAPPIAIRSKSRCTCRGGQQQGAAAVGTTRRGRRPAGESP